MDAIKNMETKMYRTIGYVFLVLLIGTFAIA